MKRLALAVIVALQSTAANAAGCDEVMAAGIKSLGVPSKLTIVTAGIRIMPSTTVVITVDGKRYSKRDKRPWIMTPFDRAAAEAGYRSTFSGADNECKAAGSGVLNGSATDMFDSNYSDAHGAPVHEHIWISRVTGLPIREEVTSVNGSFNLHTTTTMEYEDVHAPAGLPTSPPDTDFPDDGPTSEGQGRH